VSPLAIVLLAPLLSGFGLLEGRNAEVEQGNAALKAGKADDALAHYDKAVAKLPADAGAHFDRGAALYALSRFEEAGQEFLRASQAPDVRLKADAFLNLGNAFFKKEKFKEAVEAYKRTLALRSGDQTAKWNLELALAKQKEEEKKKQDQQDKDKKDQDNKEKKEKKDQQDKKDQDKDKDQQDKKQDQDKDKQQKKDEKSERDKDKQDQKQDQKQEKQPPPKQEAAGEQQIEAVLDNLERSSKDLEKERARLRAVRRRPPAKDW
jgi:tetratricopeptide (TPR) repeat protein